MDLATLGLVAATSTYSAEFLMYSYKVEPCTREDNHDWARCPYAHAKEKAKRRDPRRFKYASLPCPDTMQGRSCPRGDPCPYTHSVQEYWLHPDRFRTQMCKNGAHCKRPLCFFAHRAEELRFPDSEAPPSDSNLALCVEASGGSATSMGSRRDCATAVAAVAAAAAAAGPAPPAIMAGAQPLAFPASVAVSEVLTEYMQQDVDMLPSGALAALPPAQQQQLAGSGAAYMQAPSAGGLACSGGLSPGLLSLSGSSNQEQTARLRSYLEQQQRAVQQQRTTLEQQRLMLELRQQQLQQRQLQLRQLQQEQEASSAFCVSPRIPSNTSTTSHLSASTLTTAPDVLQLPLLGTGNEGLYWPQSTPLLAPVNAVNHPVNAATATAGALQNLRQEGVQMRPWQMEQQAQAPLQLVQQQQQQAPQVYDLNLGGGMPYHRFMGPQ